jgi:hypothetical protein
MMIPEPEKNNSNSPPAHTDMKKQPSYYQDVLMADVPLASTNPYTNPATLSTLMFGTVRECDKHVRHDAFRAAHIPRLYMSALKAIHDTPEAANHVETRQERHELGVHLVNTTLSMGVYKFTPEEQQLINWICQDILPQLAAIIGDLLDGKYDLQMKGCKECMKGQCVVL